MHVVHISSVHAAADPRIRQKQLRSVLEEGWDATLVTGDLGAVPDDGVDIVLVPPGNRHRVRRMVVTTPRAVLRAARLQADVYHFHDPELIPWAWLLRLKGRPVIYDIHEDYVTAIRQKRYLPRWLRGGLARLVGLVERITAAPFTTVIAERYYGRRFPDATPVLNYPPEALLELPLAFDPDSDRVIYSGTVTLDRGALQMARLPRTVPGIRVTVIGRTSTDLAEAMRQEAAGAADRLRLIGEGRYVPYAEILDEYRRGGWLAGLALFPDTPHYREKQLTKLFEYMAVGIPIVASDFPAWRALISDQGVGICVNPGDPRAHADAVRWLQQHPAEAREMAETGRRLARDEYNWRTQAQRLVELYRRLERQG